MVDFGGNLRRLSRSTGFLKTLTFPFSRTGVSVRTKSLAACGSAAKFHRREEKPIWWRRFDRQKMDEQKLIDDPDCLGGLVRTTRPPQPLPKPKRSTLYEFSFDSHQETKVRQGDACTFAHDYKQKATIHELDFDHGTVTLVIGNQRGAPLDRLSLAPDEPTPLTLTTLLNQTVEPAAMAVPLKFELITPVEELIASPDGRPVAVNVGGS